MIWKFLVQLGFISIFVSIVTFWIAQYNEYIKIGNNINVETINNITFSDIILSDKDDEWMYLNKMSNLVYKDNWNYITQYYSKECVEKYIVVALNMDSLNTLISLRQTGDPITKHSEDIKKFTTELKKSLNEIYSQCKRAKFKIIFGKYNY